MLIFKSLNLKSLNGIGVPTTFGRHCSLKSTPMQLSFEFSNEKRELLEALNDFS